MEQPAVLDASVQRQLDDIDKKLDFLTAQLEESQRRNRVRDELNEDLVRVGREAFQAAIGELDEVAQHFDTKDLLFLVKTLMRNVKTLVSVVQQFQSVYDLAQDVQPLGKEMFNTLLKRLEKMDEKGYFEFARETALIADTIVTSFEVEDVRLLRQNITHLLMTVKNLTQPEMLTTMNNAVDFYRKMEFHPDDTITYRRLIGELRKPETKRGIAFLVQFLQRMSEESPATNVHSINRTRSE